MGDCSQIGLDLVFEQAALLGVEALAELLALGSELHALQERVLARELGVRGLWLCLSSVWWRAIRSPLSLAHEAGDHLAQLLCAEIAQGLLRHRHDCQCAKQARALSCANHGLQQTAMRHKPQPSALELG